MLNYRIKCICIQSACIFTQYYNYQENYLIFDYDRLHLENIKLMLPTFVTLFLSISLSPKIIKHYNVILEIIQYF